MYMYKTERSVGPNFWVFSITSLFAKNISALQNILPFAWGENGIKVIIDPSFDAKMFSF